MRKFCSRVQQDAGLRALFVLYIALQGRTDITNRQRRRFERLVNPHLATCSQCQLAMENMASMERRITGEKAPSAGPEPPDIPPTEKLRCRLHSQCPGPRLSLPLGGHDDQIDLGEQVA